MVQAKLKEALAPYSTIGLGGPCYAMISCSSEAELIEGLAWAKSKGKPWRILGGGSNILVNDAGLDVVVLKLDMMGITFADHGEGRIYEVAAGENWDKFVATTVQDGFQGVECLSGIPGSVGGTPIQNVGAYGQDVSQTIQSVRAYDTWRDQMVTLPHRDCFFRYRDSIFKNKARGRYIITAVGFFLKGLIKQTVSYPELARVVASALGKKNGRVTGPEWLSLVRHTVITIRRGKGMVIDPSDGDSRSLGSFFTNALLSEPEWLAVKAKADARGFTATAYPEGDRWKVSAAWLIEHSGVEKGLMQNGVGVSSKHVLALINCGTGSTRAILELAMQIQAKVQETFGVTLHPEPEIWM